MYQETSDRIMTRHLAVPQVARSNQVWATDITCIPMVCGLVYLVAIMDWYLRKVLSWHVSNTLDTRFCVDALEEAVEACGAPEIFNTDQGSQVQQRRVHRCHQAARYSH